MTLVFEREKETVKKMCGSPPLKFIVKYFAPLIVELEDHQNFLLWRKGGRAAQRKLDPNVKSTGAVLTLLHFLLVLFKLSALRNLPS